ncbi:hypothetical protein M8C13_32905 [Crossiella sp. SN42]|uniref:hypothetical protein n=1 Tax=Crossiella sp. SN42 TaxID=2944808 RepID=UPI00207D2226|nr:hypothetical protein [Crossiella sp. SN42]MCO1580566.1 hypothetical protein [Crossiella sp. SN42]
MSQQEQVRRDRSTMSSRLVITLLFTVVQAGALVVVLGEFPAEGVLRVALAVALAGTVLSVLNAWEEVLLSSRRGCRRDR